MNDSVTAHDIAEMRYLVDRLNRASEAYYNSGQEIMSNYEFDQLANKLKELEAKTGQIFPNSPSVNVGFAPVSDLPKFEHTLPMLSLDKTKDVAAFCNVFSKGVAASNSPDRDDIVLMWKEDGCTVVAYYENGNLANLVTHGNGHIGSDITHNARSVKGVPLTIPFKGRLVVRGEALMSYSDFEAINSAIPDVEDKYKNARNLASSTVTMKDPAQVAERNIQIKAFNLCFAEDQTILTFSDRLEFLRSLGFDVIEYVKCPVTQLADEIKAMTDQVADYPYPVDGLVACMDNMSYTKDLEGTEHHCHVLQGYALKWEDETKKTTLRDIEWSPSLTGKFNPVAIFDPVELDGTTVTRASLHNVSYIISKNLNIGDTITVYKSNMIIPQVGENLSADGITDMKVIAERTDKIYAQIPKVCPSCGSELMVSMNIATNTLYCNNPNCREKILGKLDNFCQRDCMDIQDVSRETINKLYDSDIIKEYADFFDIKNRRRAALIPGFGEQSWSKLCKAVEVARNTTFVRFFTALSIPRIGAGQLKNIKRFLEDNYDSLVDQVGLTNEPCSLPILFSALGVKDFNFATIPGFGEILGYELTKWIKAHFNLIDGEDTPETRVLFEVTITDANPEPRIKSSFAAGKSFCITGKLKSGTRNDLIKKIESVGGRYIDSVSSKTDYLINNDSTSTSGKNKDAAKFGIPVITEDEFLSKISE